MSNPKHENKQINKVYLITGIPGSGKTTLAELMKNNEKYKICEMFGTSEINGLKGKNIVVNLDKSKHKLPNFRSITSGNNNVTMIVEGIITGFDSFKNLIDAIMDGKERLLSLHIVEFKTNLNRALMLNREREDHKVDASAELIKIDVPFKKIKSYVSEKYSVKTIKHMIVDPPVLSREKTLC